MANFTSNTYTLKRKILTFYAKKRDFSIEPVKILQNLNV